MSLLKKLKMSIGLHERILPLLEKSKEFQEALQLSVDIAVYMFSFNAVVDCVTPMCAAIRKPKHDSSKNTSISLHFLLSLISTCNLTLTAFTDETYSLIERSTILETYIKNAKTIMMILNTEKSISEIKEVNPWLEKDFSMIEKMSKELNLKSLPIHGYI